VPAQAGPTGLRRLPQSSRALTQMTAKLGGNCRPTVFAHRETSLKRRYGANLESRWFAKTSTERGFSNRKEARCQRKVMVHLWSSYGPLFVLMLTERAFGSHPRRVVSVSYVRVTPFHGDILHTSRTQILPDLVPSKGKQEASSAVNADPRISGRCRALLSHVRRNAHGHHRWLAHPSNKPSGRLCRNTSLRSHGSEVGRSRLGEPCI
jgi:hypothetical protein